jgi:selenocysteine lyase/cysteine desulfurase
MEARGGTVAFNVEGVPYAEVESHARRAGVALRGGCFCNPGAAEAALGLDPARLAQCLDALGGAFTPERLSRCAGTAVGAVRASVGIANDERDIRRAVDAIASF